MAHVSARTCVQRAGVAFSWDFLFIKLSEGGTLVSWTLAQKGMSHNIDRIKDLQWVIMESLGQVQFLTFL